MGFTLGTKFNEDTQWEFTVSNETIESLVSGGGVSESDIANYCFTALIDARCKAMVAESVQQTNDGLYPWALDYCAGYMSNSGTNPCQVSMNVDKLSSEAVTCYERNLLTYYGNINGVTGHYLVMDMKNIKKWCINFDTTPIYTSGNVSSTASFPGYSGGVYAYSESNKAQIVPYDPDSEAEDPITGDLRLVNALTMNDSLWIGYLNPSANSKELLANQYMVQQAWDTAYAAANTFNAGYPQYILQGLPTSFQGWSNFPDAEFPESTGQTQGFTSYLECDDTVHSVIRVSGQYGNNQSSFQTVNIEQGNLVKTLKDVHTIEAWCGLLFIDGGVLYKPLIENKVIVGFTNDMDRPSEWDDITNVTGNNISPTPPGGGGDDDDESDDQASGGIYGGAQGMCNLYYMTASEIKNLQNWFRGTVFAPGIQIPGNFDPSDQLIGLMAFPIELGGSVDSTTITFRTADNQSVDTGVSCQKAYGDDLKFDLGTINIPARMQQRGVPFLDYSCQIEVYIPFCNVVQLDVQQVIGTTLKCEMWISPATGDVSAMLSSGTHPVAYTSGNCAQQLPISVNSYGAIAGAKMAADHKMTQAVFQAAQNVVKDITNAGAITSAVSNHTAVNGQGLVEFSRIPQVQSNTGLAVGAGIKAAGNMVNTALNLTAQNLDNRYALSVAKNSAPTHVSGSFGACTSWHFPNYCYVKITRPHFQKPDNYGHTEAVPVVATKQLSSLSGLTTCVNPDVSGIGTATMQELETIKGYLMSGVIL